MAMQDRHREMCAAVVTAAQVGLSAGISILPPVQDGSKAPMSVVIGGKRTWEPFQNVPATPGHLDRWYGEQHCTGVGFVCGAVSRGLELFEFDDRAAYEQFKEIAAETGISDLVERIEGGYLEETPGGGVHWFYYCSVVRPSTKLARREKSSAEFTDSDRRAIDNAATAGNSFRPIQCLIETKGEGGYAIVAPTFGNVHPTKGPYRLIRGGITSIVKITPEERDTLWGLARSLDALEKPAEPTRLPKPDPQSPGIPPWEDFNARSTWEEILEPHGWSRVYSRGDTTYWRRPGKNEGVSASTGHAGHDCLWVFTSSTVLEQHKGYDRIGAFVRLNHGGDFRAAARDLQAKGYGERPRPPTRDRAASTAGAAVNGAVEAEEPEPVFRGLSDDDLGLVPLTTVECEPIRWLWKYRLGRGEMALMAGDGGIGKSQVLLWIGATVTTGGNWIDGSGKAMKGDVVIVSAEDDPENTIKPRLIALGADLDRVTIVKARYVIRRPDRPPVVHLASFQDRPYWAEVFHRRPGCVLFIADPIPSYLGRGVNDSKNIEIRNIIEPFLQEIIKPAGICMLGNTHLNKTVDAKTPMHRISGSIAYGALPRNVHFVVRDPDDPMRRLIKQAKCNNAPDDLPGLAFRIEQRIIKSIQGEEIETAVPVFEAEGVTVDLGTAIGGAGIPTRRGPEPKKTTAVAEALVDFLGARGEPAPLGAIFDHIGEAGLIGHKKDDGRWSSGMLLYQARDRVPDLPAPRDGVTIGEMQQPLRYGGRAIVHWYLAASEDPPKAEPDPAKKGDWGPAPF
jgi:hypothetical protein